MIRRVFSCIVIDNDAASRQLLEAYISKISQLRLICAYDCASQALREIQSSENIPDLIFLDISIPELRDYGFMDTFNSLKPHIIVVSGDASYAVNGYYHQINDYLIKPVAFERFVSSITGILSCPRPDPGRRGGAGDVVFCEKKKCFSEFSKGNSHDLADFVLIRQKAKFVRFNIADLHSIESDKDYVRLRWGVDKIVLHMPMRRFLELLPGAPLLRINKSLAIRKSEIVDFDKGFIRTKDGNRVAVGTVYRNSIAAYLNSRDADLDLH